MNVTLSAWSCALTVMMSSLEAQRRILDMELRFMPMESWRSQRYLSNPSDPRLTETRDTWELSMAWSWMPVSAQSHVASVSKSFRDSRTYKIKHDVTNQNDLILPDKL